MVELKNVTKLYGKKAAANNVTFSVEKGEIVGFLGPNGAGKTTTMNILTGYLSATSGSAKIDGIDILDNPIEAKKRIGFLPETPPLYLDMTVGEYLSFVYSLKECKLPKKKHLDDICNVVGIKDVYNRVIKNLSKGYKQRVGIAQALVGNPPVLIFDEPTVGLDPKQIIDIRNLIRGLGKSHTIILSSHILPEVQAVCDRIIIINKGVIVANEKAENISQIVSNRFKVLAKICGPAEAVLRALRSMPEVTYAEILSNASSDDSVSYLIQSSASVDIRKPLFYMLCEKGWPLVGLESAGASLEDIFINLVDNTNRQKKEGAE
ncbi:MAG: ATP-binding cassette domain-containing protein [Ruminococcaceae bacterium]|nr:ATP-binding cassette domain-containing protein [Oscillospiraceae bacterium]